MSRNTPAQRQSSACRPGVCSASAAPLACWWESPGQCRRLYRCRCRATAKTLQSNRSPCCLEPWQLETTHRTAQMTSFIHGWWFDCFKKSATSQLRHTQTIDPSNDQGAGTRQAPVFWLSDKITGIRLWTPLSVFNLTYGVGQCHRRLLESQKMPKMYWQIKSKVPPRHPKYFDIFSYKLIFKNHIFCKWSIMCHECIKYILGRARGKYIAT